MKTSKLINKNKIKLESDRLVLRPLTPADVSERYLSWLTDNGNARNLISKAENLESLRAFVQKKMDAEDCLFFGIFEKPSLTHIGNIKFEPIEQEKGITNFGILFDPHCQGKGYGSEACRIANSFIFKDLGLKKIELSVFLDNLKAIAMYEKLGFKQTSEREYQGRRVLDMALENETLL